MRFSIHSAHNVAMEVELLSFNDGFLVSHPVNGKTIILRLEKEK
jgi:hypothetical protein